LTIRPASTRAMSGSSIRSTHARLYCRPAGLGGLRRAGRERPAGRGVPLCAGQRRILLCRRGPRRHRNGSAITAMPGAQIAQARIAGPKKFLERVQAIAPPFAVMRVRNSLALRLARIAEGTFDAAIAAATATTGPCGGRPFGARSGRRIDVFRGRNCAYNRPVPRHGMLVAAAGTGTRR